MHSISKVLAENLEASREARAAIRRYSGALLSRLGRLGAGSNNKGLPVSIQKSCGGASTIDSVRPSVVQSESAVLPASSGPSTEEADQNS